MLETDMVETSMVEDVTEEGKTKAVGEFKGSSVICGFYHCGRLPPYLTLLYLTLPYLTLPGEVSAHCFCMLSTYNSKQLGFDNKGLFGWIMLWERMLETDMVEISTVEDEMEKVKLRLKENLKEVPLYVDSTTVGGFLLT